MWDQSIVVLDAADVVLEATADGLDGGDLLPGRNALCFGDWHRDRSTAELVVVVDQLHEQHVGAHHGEVGFDVRPIADRVSLDERAGYALVDVIQRQCHRGLCDRVGGQPTPRN